VRGDVHRIKAFRDAMGREQRGSRYAVVVQSDDLFMDTLVIVPTSTSAPSMANRPEIEVAGARTRALAEQVMAVSTHRLGTVVGRVTPRELADIDEALRLVLALD
jgi:mRNA interferase MazF